MSPVFDTPINSNDQSLDRVLAAGLPVALIFTSNEPQTMLDQTMERLARQNAGSLLVVKVRASENPRACQRFEIARTPAVVTIRDGKPISQGENILAADLEKHIAYLLGKGERPAETKTASQPKRTNGDGPQERASAPSHPVNATDATFQREAIQTSKLTLVDFWAPWCGPCRMTEPILEKMARELAGQVKVVKVNVDENPHLSQQYNVQSIPTMLIIKNGQVVSRWVGAQPEPAMRSRLAPFLD